MTDQQRSDWLSVEEAAPRLGVSVSTLKRRIIQWAKDGNPIRLPDGRSVEIDAEQVERPQGYVWQVRVNGDLPPLTTDQIIELNGAHSEEPPPIRADLGTDQGNDQAATRALATIAGLVERNAALSDRVAALERVAGRTELLAEQLAGERQRAAVLQQQLVEAASKLEAELRRTWWDRLRGR